MTDLYRRILLWHKLIAQQTGGIALCAAKHTLNRTEARGWSTMFRNVADEIDAFLCDGSFLLDERGQRVYPVTVEVGAQEVQLGPPVLPKRAGGLSVAKQSLRVATRKPK